MNRDVDLFSKRCELSIARGVANRTPPAMAATLFFNSSASLAAEVVLPEPLSRRSNAVYLPCEVALHRRQAAPSIHREKFLRSADRA